MGICKAGISKKQGVQRFKVDIEITVSVGYGLCKEVEKCQNRYNETEINGIISHKVEIRKEKVLWGKKFRGFVLQGNFYYYSSSWGKKDGIKFTHFSLNT